MTLYESTDAFGPSDLPRVHSVAVSVWDPIWSQRNHVGIHHELMHILKGDVSLLIGNSRYRGRAGDTLIVPAGSEHRDAFTPGSVFEVLHVMCTWPARLQPPGPDINVDLARLRPADKRTLKSLLADVHDDFRRPMAIAAQMTGASLLRALLFVSAAVDDLRAPADPAGETETNNARRRQLIQLAKDYIRTNLHRPITLTLIAEHLGISTFHLSHIFSQESGFTLSSYLLHERMSRAAEMLADPRQRVSQVAYAVGYEDPNYFGKSFRKYFGETPGQYRVRKGKT